MKKLLFLILLVLSFALSPLTWAGSGDSVLEGKVITGTLGFDTGTSVNEFSTDGTLAGNSDDALPTEKAVKTYADTKASKTTAAWSKSIGSGGDYADWATMIAAMPDLIDHAVTVTIKAGTTLTEICNLINKHGLTSTETITIQAEKYFPTSGVIPTADSATATTLRDAALATAALGNDYFNGCWVFVVDGTGTDNGFVAITDYVDATGDVVVASWPGTQPDNTSRYLIVGALIDCQGIRKYGFEISLVSCPLTTQGVGIKNADQYNISTSYSTRTRFYYCGIHGADLSGFYSTSNTYCRLYYCGLVGNNTDNSSGQGGVLMSATGYGHFNTCALSDNNQRGIYVINGSYSQIINCFGNANGTWGTYATSSGQANISGTECSGSSGNHSNGAGDGSLAY